MNPNYEEMKTDLQKLVKLYTKAEKATTRKQARKVLKKADKFEQKQGESNHGGNAC